MPGLRAFGVLGQAGLPCREIYQRGEQVDYYTGEENVAAKWDGRVKK